MMKRISELLHLKYSDSFLDGADGSPVLFNYADGDVAPLGAPDGNINAADYLIMQRIVLDQISPSDLELSHGDIYPPGAPDGVINVQDFIIHRKLLQ